MDVPWKEGSFCVGFLFVVILVLLHRHHYTLKKPKTTTNPYIPVSF